MKHGNRKFSKSSFSRACLFLLPSLISVLVLFVMPYLDVIRRSFLDGTGQRFVGMENYKTVVENTVLPTGSRKYGFIFISMRAITFVFVIIYCNLSAEK